MNRFALTLSLALISTAAVGVNDATNATAPVPRIQKFPHRTIELDADLSLSPTSLGPAAVLLP